MSEAEVNVIVNGAETGAAKLKQVRTEMSQVGGTSKLAAVQMLGLAASASSLYFQFNNLDKIQLRITKQQRLMEEQQAKVNKIIKEGGKNTQEYQFELRQLGEQQERLTQLQGDLTQAQSAFIFGVGSVALQIPTAIIAMKGLTAAIHLNKLAWLAHPLGIVLIAATTAAIAIYASNIGGIKDKTDAWTASIYRNAFASKESNKAYGDVSDTLESDFVPAVSSSRKEVDRYSSSIDRSTELVKTWSKINKEALEDIKKNETELGSYLNYVDRVRLQTMAGFAQIVTGTRTAQAIIAEFWKGQTGIGAKVGGGDPRLGLSAEALQRWISNPSSLANALQTGRFRNITKGAFPQSDPSGVVEARSLSRTVKGTTAKVSGLSVKRGIKKHRHGSRDRIFDEFEVGSLRELNRRGYHPKDFTSPLRSIQGIGALGRAQTFLASLLAQEESTRLAEVNRISGLASLAGVSFEYANNRILVGAEDELRHMAEYRARTLSMSTGVVN